MKKFWLSGIILALAILNIQAQKVRFAIFANPSISYFKTDVSAIEPDGSRIGINAGLMIDKFFAEHYVFTTGISIKTMGGELTYKEGKTNFQSTNNLITSLLPNTTVKYKLQYIHVPLTLKLKTTEIGYITYFGQLGLDPMVNVKATADIDQLDQSNLGVGKEITPVYMAYHIGAGIEYRILGSTALMLGLTYMNGFTDVTSNVGNTTEKSVIHSFEIKLGVIF